MSPPTRSQRRKAVSESGYKSKFEAWFAALAGDKATYETTKIRYTIPASNHTYTPDWTITGNVFIEQKGYFTAADRKKMLLIKEQHPDKTFYLLFQNAYAKIHKNSKTRYCDWADKYGFEWADQSDRDTYLDWLKEGKK